MKVFKIKIEEKGTECVCSDINIVLSTINSMEVEDKVIIICSEITEEEYNNLPEFDGF